MASLGVARGELVERAYAGATSLVSALSRLLDKHIEPERVARTAVLLCRSGVSASSPLIVRTADACAGAQRNDGGWSDVVESAWCLSLLRAFPNLSERFERGLAWIESQRHESGGWGRTLRDMPRIPVTGQVLWLIPETGERPPYDWLLEEWERESSAPPRLSYKAAFALLALSARSAAEDVRHADSIVKILLEEQNSDGGWGPWKNHPIGSNPFCTGLVLSALCHFPRATLCDTIDKAVLWLISNQLTDGMWPDHYLEEGSGWAVYSLTRAAALRR